MTVLQCFKPGAEKGRVLLTVDLTNAGNTDDVLSRLSEMGYQPTIRHISYSSGVRVHAVLKDEPRSLDDAPMMDEWFTLANTLGSDAVLLWRGEHDE
jgi:hypothetical protein